MTLLSCIRKMNLNVRSVLINSLHPVSKIYDYLIFMFGYFPLLIGANFCKLTNSRIYLTTFTMVFSTRIIQLLFHLKYEYNINGEGFNTNSNICFII